MSIKAKALLWQAITFLVMGLALFVPAGTAAWLAAWAYLILFFVYGAALTLWLLRHDPGLLEERMGVRPQKPGIRCLSQCCLSFFLSGWS